jgi:UDP-N-acetylglucosamine/UDP-N-acetylgalactosamine diphosphorylase
MSSRPGQDWRALFGRHGQEHVIEHLGRLPPERRPSFERELAALDLELLEALRALAKREAAAPAPGALGPPDVRKKGEDPGFDVAAAAIGRRLLAQGRVACVLVAGGQGSRLRHPGPKGTYPATPVRGKPLFRVHAERVLAAARASGRAIPLCVMTSVENDAETRAAFHAAGFYGLPPESVHFFTQGMLPAIDAEGRLVIRAPGALFQSPDGHGGTLLALLRTGLLDRLEAAGVEHLFYFQVDNPLVDVCDPVFAGMHASFGSDFSSKVVEKTHPDEKVGVLARRDGRTVLIEYSDLPPELRGARTGTGSLRYSAGNIAIHMLRTAFVRQVAAGPSRLPYHVARKALPVVDENGTAREVQGIKFETFIFDALEHAENPLVLEVRRADEFAPIKNATGADSQATSMALQTDRFARLIEATGRAVPRDASGRPAVAIEISPLFAATAAELRAKLPENLAFDRPLYLGDA